MNTILFVSCLLTLPAAAKTNLPDGRVSAADDTPIPAIVPTAATVPRPLAGAARLRHAYEVRRRTSQLLRLEAKTAGATNRAAVRELIAWYCTLRTDTALTDNELSRLAPRVRARLARIADRIERQEARDRPVTEEDRPHLRIDKEIGQNLAYGRAGKKPQLLLESASESATRGHGVGLPGGADVVAQFAGGGLGGGGGGPGFGGGGGGAFQGIQDTGDDLVELIQRVISPETWDVNGGPGSVYYYRPLRVLVINAPGEVHGRVGGVLNDLRAAGN